MKNVSHSWKVLLVALAGFDFWTQGAQAHNYTVSNTSTSSQTLNNGDTETVTSTGKLSVTSGTAIAVAGTSTSAANQIVITNSGTITTGTAKSGGRAIRDQSGGSNSLITNNAGALIQSAGNDTIAVNVNSTSGVTDSVIDIENHGTIQSLDAGGSGTTTPSAAGNQPINLTATTGSNTVANYSTGVIWATAADAVRPGVNGVVHNDGFIYSNAYNGSSSDGIDGQTDSGISIVNGYTTSSANVAEYQGALTGYVGAATSVTMTQSTIEGARHGITGGNTSTAGGATQLGGYTGTGAYTMTIVNNQGAIIEGNNGSGINIDGFGIQGANNTLYTNESVSVTNYGQIIGDGQTGDGDGVDVDGDVSIDNYGSIISKNAVPESGSPTGSIEFSEGVTVGGGTIKNELNSTIEGEVANGNTQGVGRGITLAGIDHDANDNSSPIQSIYENSTITNSGLIKGDSESGIAVLGTTGGGYLVTITNNATGTIEGNNSGVSEDSIISSGPDMGESSGQSKNQAAIELDDAGNSYVINDYGAITQDNANGTAVAMNGASNNLNVDGGGASITGNVSGNTAANSTLTIDPGSGNSFSYGYKISNFSVQINADGKNGLVTLSGANTYSGATTVNAGTLDLTGSIASSATTVESTGTVEGTGTAGAVRVTSGGTLSPGDASTVLASTQAGSTKFQLNLSGLTLDSGSTLSFDLYHAMPSTGTTADPAGGTMIDMGMGAFDAGTNVTAGSIELNFNDTAINGDVNDPNVYTLAEFGTTDLALSDFSVENLSSSLKSSDYTLEYVNLGDGQTALDLDVVPEPGTWALLLAGLACWPFFRLRRQA